MPQTRQLAWLLVLFCAVVDGLTLTCSIPLQNHCLDGECGGWSWCEFR